jgi:prephenate dehydratase
MAVKRIAVHCVEIEDKPGSLHRFLSQSSLTGVDYLCFSAFSCGNNRGRVFVSANDPRSFEAFAKEAKLKVTLATGFIVDGVDRAGAAADALKGFAENGIAGIAGAAMACDGRYQMFVVVNAKDGDRAQKALGD